MNHQKRPNPDDDNWRHAVVPAAIWGVLLVLASLGGLQAGSAETAPTRSTPAAASAACTEALWHEPPTTALPAGRRGPAPCHPFTVHVAVDRR